MMDGQVNGMSLSGQRKPFTLVAGNKLNGHFSQLHTLVSS